MKILMINKYHHITGGGDTYYFQLSNLLKARGHKVIEFCLRHPKNLLSEYSDYFINGLTHGDWKYASIEKKVRAYINGIYNLEAKRKIRLLIENTRPDIAHIHNIFYQISPSILGQLKEAGIPIIQTLHDYQIICANNNLYSNGKICEACNKGRYYNILIKRCYNDSLAASFLAFSAKIIHSMFKIYHQKVDIFISPSQFVKDKLVSNGIKKSKILVLPNMINLEKISPTYDHEDYVTFIGRFVRHKGIMTLIKAFKELSIKLIILGSGELQTRIENYIKANSLKNINLVGFLKGERFNQIIKSAKFVILPSEWYENSPLVIYESFARGKPIIASNIGGIPELVTEDVGLLFEPSNIEDLREKITTLYNNDDLVMEMGKNARKKVEENYNPERHYLRIMEVYNLVLSKGKYAKT